MKLTSLLHSDLIFWDLEIDKIEDLYRLITTEISAKFSIDADSAYKAFIERDKLGYTILPNKISFPHGRLENFNDLIISIVKLKKPLVLRNQEVEFLVMLLTSNVGSNLYLKTLGTFARIAKEFGHDIKACRDKNNFLDFLETKNIYVNEIVRIKDILATEKNVVTITPDSNIMTAVDLMKQNNITFVPVVDKSYKYLGKVDLIDILKIAYPKYIMELNDLSFLTNFRAYEEFALKEKTIMIQNVYVQAKNKIINKNKTIIELGFLLLKNHWQHITIVDDNNTVCGVIGVNDIVNSILRA